MKIINNEIISLTRADWMVSGSAASIDGLFIIKR